MTYPVTIIDNMTPQPNGAGWIFTRTWYSPEHPQSGAEWTLAVGQFAMMSLDDAIDEAERLGLPRLADKQLFGIWQNVGPVQ